MGKQRGAAENNEVGTKPRIFLEILLGIGVSAIFYVMVWGAFASGLGLLLHLLISLVLVGALMIVFWLLKSGRRVAAITILVMLFAPMLVAVVIGALGLLFLPV